MKPSERMRKVVDYTGLGVVVLAKKLNLSRGRIRDIIVTDAKSIPLDVADAVCANYAEISHVWLLKDEGEMFVSAEEKPIPESANVPLDLRYAITELIAICKSQQEQIAQLLNRDEEFIKRHIEDVAIMHELLENYKCQRGSDSPNKGD